MGRAIKTVTGKLAKSVTAATLLHAFFKKLFWSFLTSLKVK